MKQEFKFKYKSARAYEEAAFKKKNEANAVGQKRSQTWKDMEADSKKLEAELKALRKPYEKKIADLDKKEDKLKNEADKLECEKRDFLRYQTFKDALVRKEFCDVEATAYLNYHGLLGGWHSANEVTLKKAFENGVKVFRQYEDGDFTKLFAFKGLKLVGFWCKRKAEHVADKVEGRAWFGVNVLRDDYYDREDEKIVPANDLETIFMRKMPRKDGAVHRETHPFYRETKPKSRWGCGSHKTDCTIKQFLDFMEKQTEFKHEINLKDEKTRRILRDTPRS